jgi:hypothetical protein
MWFVCNEGVIQSARIGRQMPFDIPCDPAAWLTGPVGVRFRLRCAIRGSASIHQHSCSVWQDEEGCIPFASGNLMDIKHAGSPRRERIADLTVRLTDEGRPGPNDKCQCD